MANKESWGSRVGLILAMAGNAVGLGNFLRFPVQAIQNGGGAFIIPYLVCFLLMGLPLLYVEWAMGRFGGKSSNHSTPFILDSMGKKRLWKYVGVFGIFTNIAVAAYYCYLESWTLSYVYHSVIGTFQGMSQDAVGGFFGNYVDVAKNNASFPFEAIIFWILCLFLNTWILSKGLSGGVEKTAKIGMPLLIVFGIFLAIQGVTLKAGQHHAIHPGTLGLNYLWTPEFSSIWNAKVWLAAAGQIFFTLSLGMGSIHCYASYIKANDDIALNSQSAGWMNEFVEVVLGSSILIPIAIGYLGIDQVVEMTKTGGLGLGFKTLPYLFQQWGPTLAMVSGVMWFGLLFFAGITSSLAMGTPWMGFFEDEFGWSRQKGAWTFGLVVMILGLPTVLFFNQGVFDEFDYWAGTVSLVVFAFIEILLFAWVFGIDKGWREITTGADIVVPTIYKFIIKYITPLILGFVFFASIPDIWNTIQHTSTKTEIAEASNPQKLKDDIYQIRNNELAHLSDSVIYHGEDIMNNQTLDKKTKSSIFAVREKQKLYETYTAETFSLNTFIREKENIMWFKNISRPFLIIVFLLIAYTVHLASKKRRQTNPQ
jgi:SNF family Na+-dependent transporter